MNSGLKILMLFSVLLLFAAVDIFLIPDFISPFNTDTLSTEILFRFRLPKTITAIVCGMSLAVSGFILQQLFRNNLAGPYILGVSSGSSLAVAIVLLAGSLIGLQPGTIGIPLAGICGAVAVLVLILSISKRYGYGSVLLLFGVIFGQLSGSLQSLLNYAALPGDLKHFMLWTMGSFMRVSGIDLIIFCLLTISTLVLSYRYMRPLEVMIIGDETARTLGVNVRSVSTMLLLFTGILSGICTAYCGPVAFIGMAIPNACRLVFKTADFRFLLIANALAGALMAVVSDTIASVSILGINVPVSVCTSVIGGPFILYILLRKRN